jgi:hypothetical protein
LRKLIFILFPVFCYGQVTITRATSSGEHNCSGAGLVSVQHNNITLTQDKLYLAVVFADSTNVYGSSVTSTSFTWDILAQVGNFKRRVSIYRCVPSSTTTTDDPLVTFPFGDFPNMIDFTIWEITGVPMTNNGADAIIQSVKDSATSSTTALITLATLQPRASVFTCFTNSLNPFGGSVESGWTEQVDQGCATFSGSTNISGQYIMTRIATTDNTPSATVSSSDWLGVSIELRASGRRATVIN